MPTTTPEEEALRAEWRQSLAELETAITSKIMRTVNQRNARGLGSGFSSSAMNADSIGALVAQSAEVKSFLSGSLRGAARVGVPGRLVRKSIVTIGDGLATGVQTDLPAPLPTPPLALAALIPQVPLSEGAFQFIRQLAPRAIAGVQIHEGDQKAQASLQFQPVTLTPETLACWVPISKQAATDVGGLMQLIETDLLTAIRILEESEILSGDGTPGHLTGLLPVATAVDTTGATTAIDAVASLIGSLVAQGVSVTGVVLNPADWLAMALAKAVPGGVYVLGPPTQPPSQVLWGVGLALSSAMPAGTALAGDFQRGCTLRYREDSNVQISSEHEDYFVRNLLAVRAEERLLLAVRQPGSFAKTTLGATTARQAERT